MTTVKALELQAPPNSPWSFHTASVILTSWPQSRNDREGFTDPRWRTLKIKSYHRFQSQLTSANIYKRTFPTFILRNYEIFHIGRRL